MPTANTHPEDIKARVYKKGVTLQDIANAAKVSGDTVRKSVRVPCPKGNRVIADFLGVPLCTLWPEWYDARNNRLHPIDVIRSTHPRHCQKRRAA